MPVGTSDGEFYQDGMEYRVASMSKKQMSDEQEMAENNASGDFQSRFLASNVPDSSGIDKGQLRDVGFNSLAAAHDYDYKGAVAAGVTPDERGHLPDTYKLPSHITFSDESKYSNDTTPGGKWEQGADKKWSFTPSAYNLTQHSPQELQDYFSKYEPDSTLKMPPEASRKPAGALKSTEGSQTPDDEEKIRKGFMEKLTGDPDYSWDRLNQNFQKGQEEYAKMTPEERRDEAMNVAMAAGPGTMAGVKGISNLKGAAKNEALSNLGHAQVLEANGINADAIHTTTGFSRGADSRWRWEIDDSKAKFFPENLGKKGGGAFLSDIYAHPELYAAYPHLKSARVFTEPGESGARYYRSMGFDHIILGDKPMWDGRVASKDQGILAHEIQHAIQEHEGFAKGASYEGTVETNPEGAKYYTRSAGEVEARNVDTRLDLSEARRRATPPTWSEDIPRYQQLVTKGVGIGTAKGLEDSKTGRMMQSKDNVTNIRRAANDNVPFTERFKADLPKYDVSEDIHPITKMLQDHFNETVTKPHEEFIKKYDELHAHGQWMNNPLNYSETAVAKYNKMGRELSKISGGEWEDLKYNPYPKDMVERAQIKQKALELEDASTKWAQGLMTNKEFRDLVKEHGWHIDSNALRGKKNSQISVFDPGGNEHILQP